MNFYSRFSISLLASGLILIAGCSGSGVSGPSGPGVRVINGLTTVSQAYVTAGTQIIATPLLYATISGTPAHPYSIIPSVAETLSIASVTTPTTVVASTPVTLSTIQDIDAIAYNSASPQFLVLYDSLQIPTASAIRLVNASTATGPVDLFLTPTGGQNGAPITLAPGAVSPAQTPQTGVYTTLNTSGSYQLTLYPAGNDSGTPLTTETVSLPAGVSWTFVILDPAPGLSSPTVLQIQDSLLHDTAVWRLRP